MQSVTKSKPPLAGIVLSPLFCFSLFFTSCLVQSIRCVASLAEPLLNDAFGIPDSWNVLFEKKVIEQVKKKKPMLFH
jgi:hypothetical protein